MVLTGAGPAFPALTERRGLSCSTLANSAPSRAEHTPSCGTGIWNGLIGRQPPAIARCAGTVDVV